MEVVFAGSPSSLGAAETSNNGAKRNQEIWEKCMMRKRRKKIGGEEDLRMSVGTALELVGIFLITELFWSLPGRRPTKKKSPQGTCDHFFNDVA